MAELLDEVLIKEKEKLVNFLKNDKVFMNHLSQDKITILNNNPTIEYIFDLIDMYPSLDEQRKLIGMIGNNYCKIFSYHTKIESERLKKLNMTCNYFDCHY
ncbi:MAG: hypothetical protein PHN56_01130 [Candidatus Nanoarchaeia archaeon]|nr:hypothetical protein [Candidatus Nanoarchaeia archaeon]